jgi:HK97 family phage portal protein
VILATPHGNRLARAAGGSISPPPPGSPEAGYGSGTGRRSRQLAVAAVGAAVRLVSETMGSFIMRVYEGDGHQRQPVMDSRTAALFQDPSEGGSSFDLWADVAVSLELERHAFLWKVMDGRTVVELIPMDPGLFRVSRTRVTDPKRIEAYIDGRREDVTGQVIHIRSWAAVPGIEGVSTLDMHRTTFEAAGELDEYRGRYFRNDATPGIVLVHPGKPNLTQRRELLSSWMRRHGGPRNAGRPGITWGGIDIKQLGASMRDAQAAEQAEAVARDVARAFRIYPADLIAAVLRNSVPTSAEIISDLFLRFSMLGRMRRIERGISADRDLFPDRSTYARFDAWDFVRSDFQTLAGVARDGLQVGFYSQNESRALMGLPPVAGGDKLNWPPVGATSPAKGGGGITPSDDDPDDDVADGDPEEE